MSADSVGTAAHGFCANTASFWQFIGIVLLVFKIVVPIVLIVYGMVDLGKAVISSDDKAVTGAVKTLAYRVIAAIIIFFIPTLISAVFSLVGTFNEDAKEDYNVCKTCITHPNRDADIEGSCKYHMQAE
ncbi:MAG: hypothetical protein E7172_00010 [Firmicutes bacterium]|nr:hypothetical protein [Bacillota bacterium]